MQLSLRLALEAEAVKIAPLQGGDMQLRWPASRVEIAKIQSVRKRRAVELAMRAPFFHDRLKGIDLDRLDDPAVWTKICC